jgi:hypothetical protein
MCFAPWVSLTSAILDFLVALFLLTYYRRSFFNRSAAIFISLLGLYQLTEYLLCTTQTPFLWARLGFIVYTFLPALGVYFGLRYTRHHYSQHWIFILPVFFSLYAIFKQDFIISAQCAAVFVMVKTVLFPFLQNWILSILYWWIYYFGFVVTAGYLIYKKYLRDKNKVVKREDEFIFLAAGLTLFAPLVFILTLPAFYIKFPSIYCAFGLFFAVVAIIIAETDKHRQKRLLKHR